MKIMRKGKNSLEDYKNNAEEDYRETPLSVLQYIRKLEENTKHDIYYYIFIFMLFNVMFWIGKLT